MLSLLYETFVWRALLAGVGIALASAPLGCFVVWRRMAYFGEAIAHSTLLGIALGLILNLPMQLALLGIFCIFGASFLYLQLRSAFSADTLLGVLSHAALAVGLVAYTAVGSGRGLERYLFGDILILSWEQLLWIYGSIPVVWGILWMNWKVLLAATIHTELAQAEGLSVQKAQLWLVFALVLVISIGIQMIGLLLVSSFLVIPAAAALPLARSPEQMVFISIGIGGLGTLLGILSSLQWDTPTGPTIVVVLVMFFAISVAGRQLVKAYQVFRAGKISTQDHKK